MSTSTTAFQIVTAIYGSIVIIISAESYRHDLNIIVGSENVYNENNISQHYRNTSKSIVVYSATRSLVNKSECVGIQKREAKSIQKWKEYEIAPKDDHNTNKDVAFQNEQKSTALLAIPQTALYLYNHEGVRDKNEEPSDSKTQDTTALMPNKVATAKQPVLVKTLVDKMRLSSEHRLATNCKGATDSIQTPPVIELLNYIAERYLFHCISLILYDDFYEKQYYLMQALLNTYPLTFIHGKIWNQNLLDPPDMRCRDFLLFISDLKTAEAVTGSHSISRVIVVSQASRWRISEFLNSKISRNLVNLLVIGNQNQSDPVRRQNIDVNLYTHDLFINGLGASSLRVLTAWRCGSLTRPKINLFPEKMRNGFMGHQFVVAAGHQPPFVVKRGQFFDGRRMVTSWDGTEIRLLWLMAEMLNFTFIVEEPAEALFLPEASNAVVKEVLAGRADIGIAGIYITSSRVTALTMSAPHTQDCVTFMTLTSTALPRFRAIMGPFHWTVWLALTLTYLFAIFPIAFSDSHSLTHLIKDPWQIENMFWYVFGTFTNCFTFKGHHSWNKSHKAATRMLIGMYWVFSIIISACYTGCIIAFVTLPVYPSYVDNGYDVLYHGLKVGTLSNGGWRHWFNDSADPVTTKLFQKMEYLPDLESALHNVTTAYYRDYAFLGSSFLLDYIIRINYTKKSEGKRSYLHLGTDCFVPFNVALTFVPRSPHSNVMGQMLLRIVQSGLFRKLMRDLEWDLRRSSSGKLLAASSGPSLRAARVEERKLTLEDITGTFLLLGAGFGIAAFVLFIEIVVWIIKKIKKKFFSEEKCGQGPSSVDKSSDMEHEAENSERHTTLVHDYKDQPGFRKRQVHSADAILKTYEDTNEMSHYGLQFFIPLHSMTSLPITSSPKLENRRLQTPRPNDIFTVEKEAEMSGDEIPEDICFNGYGKYTEDRSSRPEFLTEEAVDKYFGAKVQKQSYHMLEEVASGSLGLRECQDIHSEKYPTEQTKDTPHDDMITLKHLEQGFL